MAGEKLIREAIEAARAAMARGALPPAENSRLTQIATTGPSYDKALRHLERAGIEGRAIDYGAGRGHGLRSIGADTFEPYPQGWTPTFTKPEDIPDDVYRRLVNLNVLNVLDPEARQSAVLNMGRVVEPGGGGVISTRGRDVMAARGEPGPEPMSLIIGEGDGARYQKGFTPRELREYVGDTLGPRFDVEPSDVGAASIMFRCNREDGGPVEERDGFAGGGVIRRAIEAARKAVAPEDLLMGIHNTAEGRKLDMIERLGGLPAPSIAITKPSQGYTSFGDISLVAPVEMVTPGRKTPVFGSDVYSPRFPDVEDDQIFRGFTPAGNRRYAPLTMGNVLREMKGNIRGGESFNYGPTSIRAQVTPQFGSLPEMQAAREKIIPSSEFGAQKDMSTEMMERLRERFEPYFKPTDPYRRSWSAFPEVLTDYARTGRPSEFAYDYKDLPAEALTDARSFLSHLRDMPTEYFEAKPQRAVPLSEFSGAVVPADVPGSVVDRIRNMGINRIEEYGDDASRAAALMKFVGEQGFAEGGAVDFNDAPNYALDNDAAFFDMSRVFPPAPGQKLTNRAENIPLTRSLAPAQPEVVDRALDVVRSEPRPMDIRVSRQAPPPPRPVPRPAPVRAPAAPDTSESRRLWEIYNETGNPADFVRASNAMRAGRADGGRLLEDQYPTQYLPNVGRQVMADGGETAQSRRRATLEQLGSFEDRPVMDPATMGENWANAVRRFRENPVRPGEATVRPLELGGRDVLGGAIAGDGGIVRSRIADIVAGSRGLPDSGTLGFGLADFTPAGVPLAVSDFSDAVRNEDYLSAGLTAALPAAYFARKPIMAAGRAVYDAGARAVDTARDVLGRVPAPVAAGGAGAAVMTPEEAEANKADAIVRAARKVIPAERPALFDYSRLGDVPHVRQFDLPRNEPPRGVPSRVLDMINNQNVRDEMLKTVEQGNQMGGSRWYNADPLREKFVEQFGLDRGEEAFRKYMDFVAATSPRSEVGANVRNASYYYNRAMSGQGMPAVGDRNPQPYGHMAQRLHQMNAERVSGAGWDPLNNPKPASFVENLVGNQRPVTVDTHAFRLPAIIARDPRFLETAFQVDKTAPKQNIAKMIESGEISMDDAANRAAYWQAQPKANEYAAMERYYKSLGQELGLTPAQTQAAAWVGGGARTGLKSDESKPFLRFVEDRIYKTADERNMDPQDVMRLFVRGEMPLYASGGAVANHAINLAREINSSPREETVP